MGVERKIVCLLTFKLATTTKFWIYIEKILHNQIFFISILNLIIVASFKQEWCFQSGHPSLNSKKKFKFPSWIEKPLLSQKIKFFCLFKQ